MDQVRGQHYDLVLNGVEIGGGSVRVHDAAMQEYIFREILQVCYGTIFQRDSPRSLIFHCRSPQLDEKEKSSFNHLLHALKCGAPPHGGFAFGELLRLLSVYAIVSDPVQVSIASWLSYARPRL